MLIINDLIGDVKDAYLGSSSDHVLDEIPVSGGVDDGDIVPGGLELPESDIYGDSSLTLSLQFVKNPCVLERSLREKDVKNFTDNMDNEN